MPSTWLNYLAVAIVLTVPSQAPRAASFMQTGNDFVAECPLDGQVYRACMAYILATGESLKVQDRNGRQPMCVPTNNSNRQLYDIVTKRLREHPRERSKPLYLLVANALVRAFPCRGKAR
jgi:hypothetical protein